MLKNPLQVPRSGSTYSNQVLYIATSNKYWKYLLILATVAAAKYTVSQKSFHL